MKWKGSYNVKDSGAREVGRFYTWVIYYTYLIPRHLFTYRSTACSQPCAYSAHAQEFGTLTLLSYKTLGLHVLSNNQCLVMTCTCNIVKDYLVGSHFLENITPLTSLMGIVSTLILKHRRLQWDLQVQKNLNQIFGEFWNSWTLRLM